MRGGKRIEMGKRSKGGERERERIWEERERE